MSVALFSGPTLGTVDVTGFTVYPPARLGSVFQAVERGHNRILLIDGYFGNCPAVWHKEILYALAKGVVVIGSSSIGALRAAELHAFGMKGHGLVYRLYRFGVVCGDDEVCLLHGPRETGYLNVTVPAINLRVTLRQGRHAGWVTAAEEHSLFVQLRRIHYTVRTWEEIEAATDRAIGGRGAPIYQGLRDNYLDVKRADAESLLRSAEGLLSSAVALKPAFRNTIHWRRQFIERLSELPELDAEVAI